MQKACDVRGRVGIFFVHKKNSKARLIIDARAVNIRFVDPPSVSLTTSEGFAMIEVELDASIDPHSAEGREALAALGLCSGIGHIADAFHRFKISLAFSSYFGLAELTAREAGVIDQDVGWGPVEANAVLVPCFTSLPVRFSWSV